MRFVLIDRIIDFQPGARITAVKSLTMAEEYLADHFPNFPVMPGVLMLEAMTQASAWLVRLSEDFAHSIIVLKQANNVKYGQFVEPGQMLTVTAEIISQTDTETKLKAQGTVDGRVTVSGRLVLERYNVADRNPLEENADEEILQEMRTLLSILYQRRLASWMVLGFQSFTSSIRMPRRGCITQKSGWVLRGPMGTSYQSR